MKKLWVVLVACGALAACSTYETDLDKAAAIRNERHQEFREKNGCPFTDDHEAYRNCVINTYYSQSPKTFVPSQTEDGRSLAIIRDDVKSSYDEETNTYKTERVVVIETVETVTDAPAAPETQAPVVEKEVVAATAVVTEKPAEPEKEQTWWDQYEKNKPVVDPAAKPQCPCPDPNAPCPQCVDK